MHATARLSACCGKAAATTLALLLSACVATPVRLSDTAEHGGFILHDENTTPVFWHRGRTGPGERIATLYADGDNVYLDERRIRANTALMNGAHVRTGPDSGALVAFEAAARGRPCQVEIRDFAVGRVLGDSANCRHNLMMPLGSGSTSAGSTRYHIEVQDERFSRITLLRGQMLLWRHGDPGYRVNLNAYQEVLLTTEGLIGPRPVSREEVERRTGWQERYRFRQSPDARAGAAAAAIFGTLFLKWFSRDDDEEPPPEKDKPDPVVVE